MLNINSSTTIIIVILATVALLMMMRLLRKYLPLFPKKEKTRELLRKQAIAAEIIIWIIYIAIITPHLIKTNIALTIIFIMLIISIIIILSFYYIKEYFAGIIFKTNYKIAENDIINFENINGRVKKLGVINIEVEASDNETYYIPYSKIKNGIVRKLSNNEKHKTCTFAFKMDSSHININTINEINSFLLSFPTVSTQNLPIIKFSQEDNPYTTVNVLFTSLDDTYNNIIIEEVKNKFKSIK